MNLLAAIKTQPAPFRRTTLNKKPQQTPFPLRMSEELKLWLQGKSKATKRSLNAEIIMCLEQVMTAEQKAVNNGG